MEYCPGAEREGGKGGAAPAAPRNLWGFIFLGGFLAGKTGEKKSQIGNCGMVWDGKVFKSHPIPWAGIIHVIPGCSSLAWENSSDFFPKSHLNFPLFHLEHVSLCPAIPIPDENIRDIPPRMGNVPA